MMQGNNQLPHIASTDHTISGSTNLLNGRQQQSHQQGDDGNDNQQFDQSKGRSMGSMDHEVPLSGHHQPETASLQTKFSSYTIRVLSFAWQLPFLLYIDCKADIW
jgi:hypothetical protein